MKKYAVVFYNHESVYTVTAEKILETNSYDAACRKADKDAFYAVVSNFEGEEKNADYVQQLYPETL
jgi:hypothetical protein